MPNCKDCNSEMEFIKEEKGFNVYECPDCLLEEREKVKKKSKKHYFLYLLISVIFLGMFVTATTIITNKDIKYGTNTTLNDTGVYYGNSKAFARTADVVVCRGTSVVDDLWKRFSCDIVCASTDNDCSDELSLSSNKVYYLGRGIFNLSSQIDLTNINNVSIIGSGIGSTIIINQGFSKNSNEPTQNLLFKDFTLDKNNITGYGFNFANNISNIYIGRVEVKNANSGFLMYWRDVDGMTVENSYFIDGGLSSSADNAAGSQRIYTSKQTIWRNNYFEKTAASAGGGLLTTGSTGDLLIEGNTFNNIAGKSYACVSIENSFGPSKDITIVDNKAYGCGFSVGNSEDLSKLINSTHISENTIFGFDRFSVSNYSNCIISTAFVTFVNDNFCLGKFNSGIILGGVYGTVIASDNYVENTNTQGSTFTSNKGGINIRNSSSIVLSDNIVFSNISTMPQGIKVNSNSPFSNVLLSNNLVSGTYTEEALDIENVGYLTLSNNQIFGVFAKDTVKTFMSSNNFGINNSNFTFSTKSYLCLDGSTCAHYLVYNGTCITNGTACIA